MARSLSLLVLFAFLLCPVPSGAQGDEAGPTPNLPRRCAVCHLDRVEDAPGFNFLTLRKPDMAGSSAMCYSCHNGPVKDSRRSAWTGRRHRADGDDGKPGPGVQASCGTCHDPHTLSGSGTVFSFMRFRTGYSGHCLKCHPGRVGGKQGEHPLLPEAAEGGGGCVTCHQMHRAEGKGLVRTSAAGSLCISCHGQNPSSSQSGAGTGSHPVGGKAPRCADCHAVHGSPQPSLVRGKVADSSLCLDCHAARHSGKSGGENHPLSPGKVECLSCHRGHNGASLDGKPALLAVKATALDTLCGRCHEGESRTDESWNHPVGIPVPPEGAPRLDKLIGYGAQFGKDSEVRCLSCHRSHGGLKNMAQLVTIRQALCLYCHAEQNSLAPNTARFGTHPVSVKPSRAVISPRLLEAGGKTGMGGELVCLTCHRIHHGEKEATGLVLPRKEYGCALCHSEKGEIASTPHNLVGEDGAEPCLACHGHHGWSIPLDEVAMGGSVVEKICWSCHGPDGSAPMSGYFGHIVGVPPSGGAAGQKLPLFWHDGRRLEQGIMTCATCHDPHRDTSGDLLRLEASEKASALCLDCHRREEAVLGTKHDMALLFPNEKNRRGESASKTGSCGSCHQVHSGGPGESWARNITVIPGEPGPLASFCTDCHRQGSMAQGKVVAERSHPAADALSGRTDVQAVDCDGCHNVHQWNPADSTDKGDFFTDGDATTSFLVKPATRDVPLCRSCHSDKMEIGGTRHDLSPPGGEGDTGGNLCSPCHIPHGGDPLLMWPETGKLEEDFGASACLSCHGEGERAASPKLQGPGHPIGVSTGPDTGEELPLYLASGRRYFRGKVACGTCHDPHRWSSVNQEGFVPPSTPGPTTSFLRVPADGFSPLCFPCHASLSLVVGTDHDLRVTAPESVNADGLTTAESGVCGSCHSVHGATEKLGLWNRGLGSGEDPQSRYCRSCHEGALEGATVPPRLEVHLVSFPGKGMVSRPFKQRGRSVMGFSTTLQLYDENGEVKDRGFISCGTCHDVHRWEPDATRSGTGLPVEGDGKNSFLKVRNTFAVASSLCDECHGDDALGLYQSYHFPSEETGGGEEE